MSELGGAAAAGRAANGGARAGGPVPVSQTQPPAPVIISSIIPPTVLMRRRAEREEAKRQAQAEKDATQRPAEGQSLTLPYRPAPAAGAAQPKPQHSSHHRASSSAQAQAQPQSPVDAAPPLSSTEQAPAASVAPRGDNAPSGAQADASARARVKPAQSDAQRQSAQRADAGSSQSQAQGQPQARPAAPTTPVRAAPTSSARPTATSSGFPHAFERWESLSSHWEGVTSYWIRRLENNIEETRGQPLVQQLSRHNTDLSAAGANLFHAVVELQRLRASSERKFQRWFYETRKESERDKEMAAALEAALIAERQGRSNDIAHMESVLTEHRAGHSRLQKLLEERERELNIAKDEARRAWEELGRQEQEARDQTAALREGQPIMIGNIQVFPSAQQTGSRRQSLGQEIAREDPGQAGSGGGDAVEPSGQPTSALVADPHVLHDPFTEPVRPRPDQLPTTNDMQPAPASSEVLEPVFYQQPQTFLHSTAYNLPNLPATAGDDAHEYSRSEAAYTSEHEEEDYEYDENGNVRTDALGNPVIFRRGHIVSDEDDDDFDMTEELERQSALLDKFGSTDPAMFDKYRAPGSGSTAVEYPVVPAPTTPRVVPTTGGTASSSRPTAGPSTSPAAAGPSSKYADAEPADYEGEGYEGWDRDGRDPNHFHTRLSVVPEQDEDARSRVSERSRETDRTAGRNPRVPPF